MPKNQNPSSKRKSQTNEEESTRNHLEKDAISNGISNSETESVCTRLVWILCAGGYEINLSETRWMDSSKTSHVLVEELENTKTRVRNLIKLGVPSWKAYEWGNSRKGYWRISNSPILHKPLETPTGMTKGSKVYKNVTNSCVTYLD